MVKHARTRSPTVPKRRFWHYGLLIFATLLLADQYTKRAIIELLPQGGSLPVFSWLRFTHIQNAGTLWGALGGANWAFIWLSVIAFGLLLFWHDKFTTIMEKAALTMLIAGLWGNLLDRVTLGYVVDYIDLGWWPAFNIADASIVTGIALFLLETIRLARKKVSSS